MTIKTRLADLLKRKKAAEPVKIFVIHEGAETGMCDGVKMTPAEWDKIKGDDDAVIHVTYKKDEKREIE